MTPKMKTHVANSAMIVGLLPFLGVFLFIALPSSHRGDAALMDAFALILGYGIAYVVGLGVAFPALLWSHCFAMSLGADTRWSLILRRAVLCSLSSIFPILTYCFLLSGPSV
jgi:hypothetical protein